MLLKTDSIELWMLASFALGFLAILGYLVRTKLRARSEKRDATIIAKLIIEYFQKTGVTLAVRCISLRHNSRYTVLIESEPMKQFRLSHIIEITLRDHVKKTCGLRLETIYWRFPIKVAPLEVNTQGQEKPKVGTDEYINEGLLNYKDVPKIEVTELSWEKFEEVSAIDTQKNIAADEPQQNS